MFPNMFDPYSQAGQMPQRCEVPHVNGQNGANAFRMAPNSSVLLLDETAPLVWFKQTDSAGYASLTPYTIAPYKPASPVDDLEARVARLEAALNGKPDSTDDGTAAER